jgi:hypothetical protein
MKYEVLVKITVSCILLYFYQHFGEVSVSSLFFSLKMEAADASEILVTICQIT